MSGAVGRAAARAPKAQGRSGGSWCGLRDRRREPAKGKQARGPSHRAQMQHRSSQTASMPASHSPRGGAGGQRGATLREIEHGLAIGGEGGGNGSQRHSEPPASRALSAPPSPCRPIPGARTSVGRMIAAAGRATASMQGDNSLRPPQALQPSSGQPTAVGAQRQVQRPAKEGVAREEAQSHSGASPTSAADRTPHPAHAGGPGRR